MKSYLLVVTTFFGLLSAFGQQSLFSGYSTSADNSVSVVEFQLGEYSLQPIVVNGIEYSIPQSANASRLLQKGAPDLIQFSSSVQIADAGNIRIEILDVQYEEFSNVRIAPSFGNIMRSENPSLSSRREGLQYSQNEFFPSKTASAGTPYLFRNVRGTAIHIYPLQYNPVTHILRVNHSIRLRVLSDADAFGVNERNPQRASKGAFGDKELYERHFLNYSTSRYEAPESQGKMLVIAHNAFAAAMEPFIAWKKQCGIPTELVNYSELGNITEITNRIREEYYNNGLRYAVLVGDIDQIPSPVRSGGASDPSYGYVEGDDAYPEVQIGRFSAESIADVQTQVQRVINYEQAQSGNHFSHVIGIASQEGPGDDGELDCEHVRNMNTVLLNYTYSEALELFDGNQGENDADGNPTAGDLATEIDEGAGLILFTGHGSSQSFGTTGFSNTDINNLNNEGKLPLIWSVACVNGEFNNGTCFAESWMRKTQNGAPAGAAGVFMSSINQSWDPPMCAQDEMVNVLAELNSTNGIRTYGGISISGCMQMNDEYGMAGAEMTDTWHLFGDPSLLVRTQTPVPMTVTHSSSVPLGISELLIFVNVENARVALIQNGNLLASGVVSGGLCTLTFDPLSDPSALELTVTAFNHIPYQGTIDVILPNGPFLIYNSNMVNDIDGNNNQLADYIENFFLNVFTENVGTQDPGQLTGVISTNSPWVTLNGATECTFYPTGNSALFGSENCFEVQVANGVPNGTVVQFNLELSGESGNTWNATIPLVLHAPEIQVTSFELVELSGNGNGRADAGEQIRIRIPNENIGSSFSETGLASMTFGTSNLQVISEELTPDAIESNSVYWSNFDYQIPADFTVPVNIPFVYNAVFGAYNADFGFTLTVGEWVEDFENGLPAANWSSSGDSPWIEDQAVVFEGTTSMKSGMITHLGQTDLLLSGNVTEAGEIKFSYKVSSEQNWDFLRFYIDGIEMANWSGIIDWTEAVFPVSIGEHVFQWSYTKDEILTANDDAAWIDLVYLPIMGEDILEIQGQSSNSTYNLYPNPATNFVSLNGCKNGEIRIDLINQLGQTLATYNGNAIENSFRIVLDTQMPAGVYWLKIADSKNELQTLRLLKF